MRLLLKTPSAEAWGHSGHITFLTQCIDICSRRTLEYVASLGLTEARLFACDGHGNGEEKISSSASIYALQLAPGILTPAGALLCHAAHVTPARTAPSPVFCAPKSCRNALSSSWRLNGLCNTAIRPGAGS